MKNGSGLTSSEGRNRLHIIQAGIQKTVSECDRRVIQKVEAMRREERMERGNAHLAVSGKAGVWRSGCMLV